MAIIFEWGSGKAEANFRKHGVSFSEATTVFADPFSLTIKAPLHPSHEERFVIVGQSHRGRTLVVIHTEREERIRIISARRASRGERKQNEEG